MGIVGGMAHGLFARVTRRDAAIRRAQSDLEGLARNRRRFLICIPFLKFGGAERVAANLAHALAHLYGPDSVAVLVTDWPRSMVRIAFPEDGDIRSWFPANVPIVRIDAMRTMQWYPMALSFRMALMTMRPELVININSGIMWEIFKHHGQELSKHMRLATVGFTPARGMDGKHIGHTKAHLK